MAVDVSFNASSRSPASASAIARFSCALRHLWLAIHNTSKQGDGIGLFAESTLDFAQQSQHSVVLGGKFRSLLQRDFRLRKSALCRQILSLFHQLVY